jgi:hypothetical protein
MQDEVRARFRGGPGGPGGPGGRGRGGDGNRGDGKRGDRTSNTIPAEWYFIQAQQEQPRGPGGRFQLTDEQRAEMEKRRLDEAREERAKLAEILLPHQLERLTQIFVQVAGVEALRDEEVAKELNISDDQTAKISEVRRTNQAAMGELFGGGGGGDRDAIRAKVEELRKAGDAKILAVLTAEQQKKFEEMKGKSFKLPEGFGRGGFGGRGGPGGPGGGPGRRGGDNNRN